ncbi:related to gamma-glutamyltranspeptidase [Saccharomycodes ludwigii]|uniref:Related to gamma-glutamyltranspeptidase n=1 Tax=Saccharomycodes ludwigii TaxID=36035 RepID=A0A376B8Y2_9ASCO|nr:hypothetical protein SCDLUD_003413 [Saccharomycodes ludwigii]KAH3900432.1 hypothetical protein SCDLUD_003413 [Saccharomycodes ludwigii]SSD60580.1 related to gamma-glutamyltranspeptidase [Saccharomycodes ludwigii]
MTDINFTCSRRSNVYSTRGMIASTQPLASAAGVKILELGGNSMDASVAVAACLCVLEPASTGIGGDCFCLHYDRSSGSVLGMNGSGRSPKELTIDRVLQASEGNKEMTRIPFDSVHSITVPGTVAGWLDSIDKFGSGKVSLAQILQPAIDLCENGFPISEISSFLTRKSWKKLEKQNNMRYDLIEVFTKHGGSIAASTGPTSGDLIINKPLGKIFKKIVNEGKDGFYKGEVAKIIVDEVQTRGGAMKLLDLSNHESTFVDPIYLDFNGYRFWETPPNSQGLVALIALGIIRELQNEGVIDIFQMKHNSADYLHILIESLKLAFYDSDEYVSDPLYQDADILPRLLSRDYLLSRSELFRKNKILDSSKITHGIPDADFNQGDTVYFTCSDDEGNATSFINSVYTNFGSGIIPSGNLDDGEIGEGLGFCLQNRGSNFNMKKGTKNSLEPNKRPYHTIIPSMITIPEIVNGEKRERLAYSLGNMGGFMQPTGHLQHFLNLTIFQMTPQESLDAPRICLSPHPKYKDRGNGSTGPVSTPVTLVSVEDEMSLDVIEALRSLGHCVEIKSGWDRSLFGRGQIIKVDHPFLAPGSIIYTAGSDKRGDGCAIPLV